MCTLSCWPQKRPPKPQISKPVMVHRPSLLPAPREAPAPPLSEPIMQVSRYSQWVRWLQSDNVSTPNLAPKALSASPTSLRRTASDAQMYAPSCAPVGIIIHLGENAGDLSDASDDVPSSHSSTYSNPDS